MTLNRITGLGLLDQLTPIKNYSSWYNSNINIIQQNSWNDTAIKVTPDPNYNMIRKRKYLNYN